MIQYQFRTLEKWPRKATPSNCQKNSPFKSTVGKTYEDLRGELDAIGAKGVVWIEAGFDRKHIRGDGLPYSNAPKPSHPGVIVYAPETSKGPLRFVCDDCRSWEDNLRAIVLTMERLRLADRYGVTKDAEQYRGFQSLPPPAPDNGCSFSSIDAAAAWVGEQVVLPAGMLLHSAQKWGEAYRTLAKQCHPDTGCTDPTAWKRLQSARELLDKHHGR